MAGGKPPAFRLKAKRQDGEDITTKDRNGDDINVQRAELGVVWENDNGMLTFKFADQRVQKYVEKLFGGACYFDLFRNDGGPKGKGAKRQPKASDNAGDEDEEF